MHLCNTWASPDVWGKLELIIYKKHWVVISKIITLLFLSHHKSTFYVWESCWGQWEKDPWGLNNTAK